MPLVTEEREFKYDVAFSFLKEDLNLAQEINDLIQDRVSTFIFTDRQDELIGQDGMTRFPEVFGKEARIVVVLYREAWGTTPWTRVEQEAIRERVLLEGPDFTVFVSLDRKKPVWLSRTQMWYDISAFQAKGAAAVITKRVTEYGGAIREETVEDRAARQQREIDFRSWFSNYYNSHEGVTEAQAEFDLLRKSATEIVERLRQANQLGIGTQSDSRYVLYHSNGAALRFGWNNTVSNSLMFAKLSVTLSDTIRYDRFRSPNDRSRTYAEATYTFSVNRSLHRGWSPSASINEFHTTDDLTRLWFKKFLDVIHENRVTGEISRLRS